LRNLLWAKHFRIVPARRRFCGQEPEGTKPADLPVEQPKKFDFIINLKFAKQINLTIPRNVLAGRDQNNDALGHQSNLWAELR